MNDKTYQSYEEKLVEAEKLIAELEKFLAIFDKKNLKKIRFFEKNT